MTKDESLKMAIEAIDYKGVRDSEPYWEMMNKAIQTCKEALAQPLTRDWKETIYERIAKDDEFKRALEQPSVAELNDEYLRDTYVQGLSQPAQEPVLLNVETHDGKTYKVEVSAPSWQGLSDDEINRIYCDVQDNCVKDFPSELYAAWIKAFKEKNNGSDVG